MAHNYALKNVPGRSTSLYLARRTQPANVPSKFDDFKIGRAYRFQEAYKRWRDETMFSPSLDDSIESEFFAEIVSLGLDVLPFIFRRLEDEPSVIFLAAEQILGRDPIGAAQYDTIEEIRQAWLTWARNDYIASAYQK